MHKMSALTLCLLSSTAIHAEIDYFKHKENVDALPTHEAYKKFIEQSDNVASQPSDNLSLQEALSLAEKARLRADTEQAITYYKMVLNHDPIHFAACFNLGNIYFIKEQPEQALHYYKQGLNNTRKAPQYYYNMGLTLKQLKKHDEAIEVFTEAIKLKPSYLKAYYQLGKELQEKSDNERAVEIFLQALELSPEDASLHQFLGKTYRNLEEYEKAIDHLRIAYRLQPKDIMIMLDLANILTMRGQLDEALGIYQKILILHPTATTAFYNIAYVLKRQGYVPEAVDILKTIIEKNPEHTQAHLSLGLCYLTLGNFDDGWREYEWRWETTKGRIPRFYAKPVWDGSDLKGKTILVIAEQGLGDSFQFIRYAKILKNMGARVIFKSRPELVELLSLCDYIDEIIANTSTLPDFDVHIPLMSIPLVLKTREETIPAEIPYLTADSDLTAQWKQKLSADKNFKIGICWQGNANYSTQFLRSTVAAKSMSVKFFEPLAKLPGVSLYSLQKIFGTDQLKDLDKSVTIHDFGPNFDKRRFMDTAAVIKNLDLIITVDTSISHLAAALGAPTWIILPEPADWRWMLKRLDTPWYPNVRLFRQQRTGDWTTVIQHIIQALMDLLSNNPQVSDQSITQGQSSTLTGISDLEQRVHQKQSTKNIEVCTELESLPLDEFIDQMTLAALDQAKDSEDAEEFLTLYKQHLAKWPQLKEYSQQILHANRYLMELQKQIEVINGNVLDPSFSEIARQVSRGSKYKAEIKKSIKKLCA